MDLLRKYLIPLYQAPDAAAAGTDPGAAASAPPPPAPTSAEPPAEPTLPLGDAAPPAEPSGDAARPPRSAAPQWALSRISEESAKAREAADRAAAAERRAQEAEALAARLQSAQPPGTAAPAARPAAPVAPPAADFPTAVRAEAQRLNLYNDTVAVRNAGVAAFPDFAQSLNILTAVGATADDFVLDVLAVDKANAHVILDKLAKDPEKAASLAGLDSRHRIAELTRMIPMPAAAPATDTKTPAAPAAAPRTTSRAPAPPPPVDPGATRTVDWRSDDSSEEDFNKGFNEWAKNLAARR